MAGHSKWANIKFRKAAQDAKRGKIFTKLIKEITVAARLGGGDADANPRLRSALDKALAANMTRDTINRAVARGSGAAAGADIEEIRYEGYAPHGVAVLVEVATDNRNRAAGEVRHIFTKYGGNLGTTGSVAYLFSHIGCLVFALDDAGAANNIDEEKIMEIALGAGAEDVDRDGEMVEVVTLPANYLAVERAFVDAGCKPQMAELIQRPSTFVDLHGDAAGAVNKLIDGLEQLDDVQNVFTNANFTGE